jgi:hypothetical protein
MRHSCAAALEQIGLAAEKRGICSTSTDFSDGGHLRGFVHVGQHRHADFAFDLSQNAQAFFHSKPAKRAAGRAIGFVIGSFEDVRQFESAVRLAASASAIFSACVSDSMTQGPAMRKS